MWLEVGTTEDSMVEAMCKKERVWLEVGVIHCIHHTV